MIEPEEQALIEQFVAHSAVKTFADAVSHGLSRGDEVPGNLVVLRPGKHCIRCKLGAMIGDDHTRRAPPLDQRCQSLRRQNMRSMAFRLR